MPSFSPDDVRELARLARVELHATEIPTFTRQLNEILEFARRIEAVDTSEVNGSAGHSESPLREDVTSPCLSRDEVLAAAPGADVTTGLFTVPRVIGERE